MSHLPQPALSMPAIPAPKDSDVRFIARQPILDRNQNLYGYELLFRAGARDLLCATDGEVATSSTLDLSLLLGAQSLTEGHRAFINCTRDSLLSGIMFTLPKEIVVLEILEDVPADDEVVHECLRLKNAGYEIALDDIVSTTERLALFEIASIIKVDFFLTSLQQQREIARRFARKGVQLLAEKVETHEQFHAALNMGYSLFQGYFFCRPETMQVKDLPCMYMGYLNILRKVYEPEIDIPALERAIREEPSLCYRLLRYLNSAAFGTYAVRSIVHALNLLGRDEIRKWVSLVAAITLAGTRSAELIRMALERARFCELLAGHLLLPSTDFFLTGLFSLLDAILDRPMSQLIEHIPISTLCRDALCGVSNPPRYALELAIASTRGDWDALPELCAALGCTELEACRWQVEARNWVGAMLHDKSPSAVCVQ
ncbi:MAG: EAL domain-containing protein [Candidatus Korobacteraceae bacterium]